MDDIITDIQKIKSKNVGELSMTTLAESDSTLLKVASCEEAFEKLLDEMLETIFMNFCFEKHKYISAIKEYKMALKESVKEESVKGEDDQEDCKRKKDDFFFLKEYIVRNGVFEEMKKDVVIELYDTPDSKTLCPHCSLYVNADFFTTHLHVIMGKKRRNKRTPVPHQPKSESIEGYSVDSFNNLPDDEKEETIRTKCLALTRKRSKDGSFLLCKKSSKCHIHRGTQTYDHLSIVLPSTSS